MRKAKVKRFSPDNEKIFVSELKEELKFIGMSLKNFSKSIFITEERGKSIFRFDSFFYEEEVEVIKKRFGLEFKK